MNDKALNFPTHDLYRRLADACKERKPVPTAVVHPVQPDVLLSAMEAARAGLIIPFLIGPSARIRLAAAEAKVDIFNWQLIDAPHSHAAAAEAVSLAARGEVGAIMKGSLHTEELLSAIFSPSISPLLNLRTERRLSHAYIMQISTYHKPFILTDAAVNIAPGLEEKADICRNAIDLWHVVFGKDAAPKVAILGAVETVTPKMAATIDAAALCKMADRGQITGAVLDGPLAFDNAISKDAAQEKGIVSPVAGDADILLVPNIEAGNMLAKELTFLGGADAAGVIMGARVPIILTSRADSLQTHLSSCALGVLVSAARREGRIK